MPMKFLPSFFATAPVEPVPKNGSNIKSPLFVEERIILCKRDSGFCVGCRVFPIFFILSFPEQIGRVQSDLICLSSFNTFIAL